MATELDQLHLADLHERAAEAGIPGYRLMRREQLVGALADEPAPSRRRSRRRRRSRGGEEAESESPRRRTPPTEAEAEADTDELAVVEGTVIDDEAEADAEADQEAPTEAVSGVLELTRQRYGFLRLGGLAPSEGDVYISAAQVRRCELRPGDDVAGPAREPRRGERHRALVHVDTVNGEDPSTENRPEFDDLPAIVPERRIDLSQAGDDVLLRAVDLLAPLAFGQRILIRAAGRSGRTTLLRSLARTAAAIDTARVIVMLVDERPEEATAWREAVPGAEFAIATAEMAPVEQVRTADLALERARRLAETGVDAVLICDSLSRLAFASGDGSEVKRLFGSGRNLAGGGSLTIAATVLADGQDEGEAERAVATTESSTIALDPRLAAAGIVPALRAADCAVSNEDQIREADELDAARKLRSLVADLDSREAADLLRERITETASNADLLRAL